VVDLAPPLKLTTDDGSKLLPFTVKVKPLLPINTELGEMLVVIGTAAIATKGRAPDTIKPVAKAAAAKRIFFIFIGFILDLWCNKALLPIELLTKNLQFYPQTLLRNRPI